MRLNLMSLAVLASVVGYCGSASAETVAEYANILRSTLNSETVIGTSISKLASDCRLSYSINEAGNEMTISLFEKRLGGISNSGLYLFITDNPNSLIFDRYKVLESKLVQNSDKHLMIQSTISNANGSDPAIQKFSLDRTTNLVTVSLFGSGSLSCQL